jgi:hypothetical protein
VGLDKIKYIKSYSATSISKLTNEQIQEVIDYGIFLKKLSLVTDHMTEISETLCPEKNLPTSEENSSDDSKEVSLNNSLEAVDDYYKMILEDCAKDCEYFDKKIDSTLQPVKETNEEVASQSEEELNEIKSDNENDSSDSGKEEDSDANKSDSDVYFKSDDSDSNDEYDYELHERLTREEMARLAKLEEKTPTESKVDDDDFNKILMEIHKNHDIYFDDPVLATKCCGSTISQVTA